MIAVRDQAEFERIVAYIHKNPVRAGLGAFHGAAQRPQDEILPH